MRKRVALRHADDTPRNLVARTQSRTYLVCMQRPSANATPPGRLVLNTVKLAELRRAHELDSDADFARFLGVERSTLYRVTNGQVAPSNGFMARMKLAFPSVSLDSLFTVDRLAAV